MIALGLSLMIPVFTGVLLLRQVWPREATPYPWPLLVTLGGGLGMGLSAVLLFLWLLVFGPTRGFALAEVGLLTLVAVTTWARGRKTTTAHNSREGRDRSPLVVLLACLFVVALGAAALAFATRVRLEPHGEWDAWMNWDLRARFILRAGEEWRSAFSPAIPWSHPDYPVLLPSLVVRSWLYAGTETLLGPALVAATFVFGTVALLVTALTALRNGSQGLVAGLVLLSTPFFVLHGTTFYADVPLGLFFLATFVFLAFDARYGPTTNRFAILAGLAAGLAMWTKNEGILFTLAVTAGLSFIGLREQRTAVPQRLRAFGLGLIPIFLVLAGFKLALAPPNDLLSTLSIERTLGRLTAPERYFIVLREYVGHIASFGSNGFGSLFWVLLAYLLGMGIRRAKSKRWWVKAGTIALVLLLAGHFMVFVSMADELSRLLASSLDRLLLQVAPSALFLFFMLVRTPDVVASHRLVPGFSREAR